MPLPYIKKSTRKMAVYTARVAAIDQSTNNQNQKIGLLQIPKPYYYEPIVIFFNGISFNLFQRIMSAVP